MKKLILILLSALVMMVSNGASAINSMGYLSPQDIEIIKAYSVDAGPSFGYGAWLYDEWRHDSGTFNQAPKAGFVISEGLGGEAVAFTAPLAQYPTTEGVGGIDTFYEVDIEKDLYIDATRNDTGAFSTVSATSSKIDMFDFQLFFYDDNWEEKASINIPGTSKFNLKAQLAKYPEYKNYAMFLNIASGTVVVPGGIEDSNYSLNGNHITNKLHYRVTSDRSKYYGKNIGYGAGEVHPSKILAFSRWAFNGIKFTASKGADLETVSTQGGTYDPGAKVTVPSVVRNNSKTEEYTSEVTFDWEFGTLKQNVTLKPGESKTVNFTVTIPNRKNDSWMYRVTINKDKTIEETTYINNAKTDYLRTGDKDTGTPSFDCPPDYTWTEIDGRMETKTGYGTDAEGNSYSYTYEEWVEYDFVYNATLNSKMTVKDDRELQSSPEMAKIKSGYGFKVDVEGTLKIVQVSGEWARDHTKSVKLPDKVSVVTSWTVRNINQIEDTTLLEKKELNVGKWGGTFKYTTPVNPKSKTGAKVIYTDIDLAGSHIKSENHPFDVKIRGAAIDVQPLCNDLEGYVEIFGDMYEDYRVN